MGKFFGNKQEATQLSPREILQNKYNAARANLIWVMAFTIINIVLLLTDSSTYFLFSLYVPYMFMLVGLVMTGKLPEVFTEIEYAQTEFLPEAALIIPAVVSVVIILLFLLCWIFSKKNRVGWLIASFVLFCLDTIFLLLSGINGDSIIDIVFHAWVIISLVGGIRAHSQLKKLPPEEEIIETTGEVVEDVAPEAIEEPTADIGE